MWLCTSSTPASGIQGQAGLSRFQTNLAYIMSSKVASAISQQKFNHITYCVWAHMWKLEENLQELVLPPPSASQEWNSGCQSWPLPTEPSLQLSLPFPFENYLSCLLRSLILFFPSIVPSYTSVFHQKQRLVIIILFCSLSLTRPFSFYFFCSL